MSYSRKSLPDSFRRCMSVEPAPPLEKFIDREDAAVSERKLQNALRDILALHGYFADGAAFGKKSTCRPGAPDFHFSVKGRTVYWEAKAKGGRLSEDQIFYHEQVKKNGALVYIVQSFDQALGILKELEKYVHEPY